MQQTIDAAWEAAIKLEEREHPLRSTGTKDNDVPQALHNKLEYKTSFENAWKRVENHKTSYEEYAALFCHQNRDKILKGLRNLWTLVANLNVVRRSPLAQENFKDTFHVIERVLVALQGHWQPQARDTAIRLLNVLSDGVDWQRDEPFQPVVKGVGDEFVIKCRIQFRLTESIEQNCRVVVSAPSFNTKSKANNIVTWHTVKVIDDGSSSNRVINKVDAQHVPDTVVPTRTSHTIRIKLNNFPRSGFYDWRAVMVSPDGIVRPLDDGRQQVQGRFVVQPRLKLMHEVLVDLEGIELVRAQGGQNVVTKRGKFDSVRNAIPKYAERHVEMINIVGALDRDNGCNSGVVQEHFKELDKFLDKSDNVDTSDTGNEAYTDDDEDDGFGVGLVDTRPDSGNSSNILDAYFMGETGQSGSDAASHPDASPTAITDRSVPNHMLGGPVAFLKLVEEAKKHDLKVSVSIPSYVSCSHHSRRYDNVLLYTMDSDGNKVVHRGTDAKENQWEDTVMLNYRKLAAWDLLIDDALNLIRVYGVQGLHLVDCQSWPQILATDLNEMLMLDSTGKPMYAPTEVLEGEIVRSNRELGYWCSHDNSHALARYPNPLLAKFCRKIWRNYPHVSIFGDSAWERCSALAASGVLPRAPNLAMALSNVHGKVLQKNGCVTTLPEDAPQKNVSPLYNYINYLSTLPPGVANMQPMTCCNPSIPYPSLLFGRGAWNMVDLLCLLPGTPMTFIGEEEGRSYRVDLANTYSHNQEWEEEEARRLAVRRRNEKNGRLKDLNQYVDYQGQWNSSSNLSSSTNQTSSQGAYEIDAMSSLNRSQQQSHQNFAVPAMMRAPPPPITPHMQANVHGGAYDIASKFSGLSVGSSSSHSTSINTGLSKDGTMGDGINDVINYDDQNNNFFFKETWHDDDYSDDLEVASMPSVRSWANIQSMKYNTSFTLSNGDSKSSMPPRVRSVHQLDTLHTPQDLNNLEETHKRNIGPEFGFDLGKISTHYAHRFGLREKYPVLTRGHLVPLEARHRHGVHQNVLAFARWLPYEGSDDPSIPTPARAREVVVVATNFNDHPSMFTVDCSSLSNVFGVNTENQTRPTVVYTMRDLVGEERSEDEDSLFTPNEAASVSALVTLKPHSSVAWRFVCEPLSQGRILGQSAAEAAKNAELFVAPGAISDIERRFFRSTLRRLHQLMVAHEDALSRQQSNLDRLLTSEGAIPDQQLASAAAHNHVFSNLRNAFEKCVARLDKLVAKLQAEEIEAKGATSTPGGEAFTPSITWQVLIEYTLTGFTMDSALGTQIDIETVNAEMHKVVRPLAQAFHVLVLQLLPRPKRDGDGERELVVLPEDKYLGVSIAAENSDVKEIVVRALAPIVRKVLFTITRLLYKMQDCERILLAFLKLVGEGTPGAEPTEVASPSSKDHSSTNDSIYALAMAKGVIESNDLGEVVFIAPELGRWSTVGGLGVMVDELTVGLAALGVNVTVVSPYYDQNKKGQRDYLRKDNILWQRNIRTNVGKDSVEMGLHEGWVNGVRVLFMHNATFFPHPYPNGNAWQTLRILILMAKGALEALCQLRLIPSMVVTNDWFTGLVAAYAKSGAFGSPSVFSNTFFFHLIHNLDPSYEGRIHVDVSEKAAMNHMHGLPPDLLVDPFWAPVNHQILLNPSRAALLCSDTWGTVSPSYRDDLLNSSPLATLLHRAPHPFAFVNGIPSIVRAERLEELKCNTHETAKAELQRKYFGFKAADLGIPLFSFVGRITRQKGVHLILNVAANLIEQCNGRIQFIVGGPANSAEKYAADCAAHMRALRERYPHSFWADPDLFFTDGPVVNLGSDFGLMPSLFEPSGIVQQEFFIGGTPVIAFLTGGLKDTVFDFNHNTLAGNGFTFQAHTIGDLTYAIQRANDTFAIPHLYKRLRENARDSVLDLASVCFAWYKEFMRCRKCIVGVSPTLVRCPVNAVVGTNSVSVVGTLTSNEIIPLEKNPVNGEFSKLFYLPDGQYSYVFVIDGKETTVSTIPVAKQEDGTKKHVVLVDSRV